MPVSIPHTPTHRSHSPRALRSTDDFRRSGRLHSAAFTLIELLMVVTVILILAGITFGISRGVQNAQARAKAQAELATISQSLEQFKSRHGDYPWTNDSEGDAPGVVLSKSLLGWKEFVTSNGSTVFRDKTQVPTGVGPENFIDATRLEFTGNLPPEADTKPLDVIFVDPWGKEYIYLYKDTSAWDNFGYILYSRGPDGDHEPVGADGILTSEIRGNVDNADNIYAGE